MENRDRNMATVKLNTSLGPVVIELDEQNTPETTKNFLQHATAGFYDNTIFHRVIKGFMIQGGGFEKEMSQKTSQTPIRNEGKTGLKNEIGTISMARTSDPHSASTQFFINVANNHFLDFKNETTDGYGYCAFGKVTEGMDVITKLSQVPTTRRAGHDDVPVEEVTLLSVEQLNA
jgi:peptidyl-prolyl cis-trans isomerase B (cyclophilin B)